MNQPLLSWRAAAAVLALAACHAFAAGDAATAGGVVEVKYVEADKFRDIGLGAIDRERTLATLTDYLHKLGAELPSGQKLHIEFTDIDLAGQINPTSAQQIRVLRGGVDWPRMDLRYSLKEGERTIKAGDAKLADMNYMNSLRAADRMLGELPYEKRLLRDWFQSTILAR